MKVFKLKKCMRITKNISEVLKVLQEETCRNISVIKHHERPNLEAKERKIVLTTPEGENNVSPVDKGSVEMWRPNAQPFIPTEIFQPKSNPTENEMLYDRTMDIDYIASKIDTSLFSDNIKTETSYVYRHFKIVGHNIDGQKPISLSIKFDSEDYQKSVALFSLALKAYCFKDDCTRLMSIGRVQISSKQYRECPCRLEGKLFLLRLTYQLEDGQQRQHES